MKTSKKVLALTMVLVWTITLLSSSIVFAIDEVGTVRVGTADAQSGQTVVIPVYVESVITLWSWNVTVDLRYDSTKLTFESAEQGSSFHDPQNPGMEYVHVSQEPGRLRLTYLGNAGQGGVYIPETYWHFADLTFTANANASGGVPVTIGSETCFGSGMNVYYGDRLELINGAVNITGTAQTPSPTPEPWVPTPGPVTSAPDPTLSPSAAPAKDFVFDAATGTITKYTGSKADIIIPSEIGGVSVTKIGSSAFSDCKNLKNITIPDSLISIANHAFSGCSGLTDVTISQNVKTIGDYAFINCIGLTNITIPKSVTSIGPGTFVGCRSIQGFSVDENNANYVSVEGVLFDKAKTTLVRYTTGKSGTYRIPDGVKRIADNAFSGSRNLTGVTVPDGVLSVGAYAFSGCSALESLELPDGVTSIGRQAFYYCTSLQSIRLPDSITAIGDEAFVVCSSLKSIDIPKGMTAISRSMLGSCSGLTEINIPDNIKTIGSFAFSGCKGLTSIDIPDSVTSIGDYTFQSCTKLSDITISRSVTSIGKNPFYVCTGLINIDVDSNNPNYSSIDGVLFNKSQTTLIRYPVARNGAYSVPDSVTGIGEYAFERCAGLTRLTIPKSVTSIGDKAFDQCILTICTESGSYAHSYAVAHHIPVEVTPSPVPSTVLPPPSPAPVDKTELAATIQEAERLYNQYRNMIWIPESDMPIKLAALRMAISRAKAVQNDPDASQEEVNKQVSDLKAKMWAIAPPTEIWVVRTLDASGVTSGSAVLSAQATLYNPDPNMFYLGALDVYYWEANNPSVKMNAGTLIVYGSAVYTKTVSGLKSNTTYYYQASLNNELGEIKSFTTMGDQVFTPSPTIAPTPAPVVTPAPVPTPLPESAYEVAIGTLTAKPGTEVTVPVTLTRVSRPLAAAVIVINYDHTKLTLTSIEAVTEAAGGIIPQASDLVTNITDAIQAPGVLQLFYFDNLNAGTKNTHITQEGVFANLKFLVSADVDAAVPITLGSDTYMTDTDMTDDWGVDAINGGISPVFPALSVPHTEFITSNDLNVTVDQASRKISYCHYKLENTAYYNLSVLKSKLSAVSGYTFEICQSDGETAAATMDPANQLVVYYEGVPVATYTFAGEIQYGDINGDGVITASDLGLLKRYLANKVTGAFAKSFATISADFNRSGTITATDLGLLKKYLMDKSQITLQQASEVFVYDPLA